MQSFLHRLWLLHKCKFCILFIISVENILAAVIVACLALIFTYKKPRRFLFLYSVNNKEGSECFLVIGTQA